MQILFNKLKYINIDGKINSTPTIKLAQKDKQNGQLIKYSIFVLLYLASMYPRIGSKISESITTYTIDFTQYFE
jgi:hypothetical protein